MQQRQYQHPMDESRFEGEVSRLPMYFSVGLLVVLIFVYFLVNTSPIILLTTEGEIFSDIFPIVAFILAGISVALSLMFVTQEKRRLNDFIDTTEKKRKQTAIILSQVIADDYSGLEKAADNDDPVILAIRQMRERFSSIQSEEIQRKKHIEGINFFLDLLRKYHTIDELATNFVNHLAKYLHSEQGAIFITQQHETHNSENIKIAGYFVSDNLVPVVKDFILGEGLHGQILKDGKTLLINDIPKGYIQINSGLGSAEPNHLLLVPLLFESKPIGVIELASFHPYTDQEVLFAEEIASKSAVTLFKLQTADHASQMLAEAQALTIELQSRETELLRTTEIVRIRDRAMASSSNGIVICDATQNDIPIVYVNPAFEQITGYMAFEAIGRNCRFLQGNEGDQPAIAELRKAIKEQKECRVLLRNFKKDGTLFFNELSVSPVLDDSGNLTHFVGIQTDVTERIEREKEIHKMNESLEDRVKQRTLELQTAMDELQNAQFRVVQAEKLASLGQLIAGVAHEINTPLAAIKAAAENMSDFLPQAIRNLPLLLLNLSEENRAIFMQLVEQSMINQEELTTRDERQLRKLYEDTLNEAGVDGARDIAKRLVTNGIRGDIKLFIPLLLLSNSKDIIQTAYHLGQMKSNLTVIGQAAAKTRKTVYALKRYSHFQQDDKLEVIDLVDSMEVILTLYHNQLKHGVTVERKFADLPPMMGYSDELGQVWTNIIHNAAQAMKFNGHLIVEIDRINESFAAVRITDNGPGIPEEIKNRIFEPFFTTKPQGEGTGLGLDICRKIVDKHKGTISVESEPGKTCFTVTLPLDLAAMMAESNGEDEN